jgi:hypothetical protein
MIDYKFQINYKIKIKQKNVKNIFCSYNSIAIRVPLKDLTHMFCVQYLISQTIWRRCLLLHSHIKIHVPCWDELIKV